MKVINKFDFIILLSLLFFCLPVNLSPFSYGFFLGISLLVVMLHSIFLGEMPDENEMRTIRIFSVLAGLLIFLAIGWFYRDRQDYIGSIRLLDGILFSLGFASGITIGIDQTIRAKYFLTKLRG